MRYPKWLIRLLLTIAMLTTPLLSEDAFVLRLRVRETGPSAALPDRRKEDLRLFVNGRPTEILALRKRSISLGRKADLGRVFVLSFRLSRIEPPLENALSYFASEVLEARDSLFVRTPISLYRLGVGPNKEGTLRRVRELVNGDGRKYGADRASTERRLEGFLTEVRGAVSGDPQAVEAYKTTALFLNSFPGEFASYRERFLLTEPGSYRWTLDQVPAGEGERWWIHFEQHETSGLFQRIRRTVESIKAYIQELGGSHQSMAQVLASQLDNVDSLIQRPEAFPAARLAETLLAREMNYHVVFFRGVKGTEGDKSETPLHNLEVLAREVTAACGGLTIASSGPGLSIKELVDHVDEYYELDYADAGPVGDRAYRVETTDGGRALSITPKLDEQLVRSRVEFQSREKIRVEGVSLEGARLQFDVLSFALNEGDKIGLLKVRVQAHDLQGREVYDQENILRATKDPVHVSLPMPGDLQGPFLVVITACDLVANRMAVVEQRIELPGSPPGLDRD